MKPYSVPVGLWLASAFGLVIMLLCGNPWDVLGLLCLTMPLVAVARAAQRSQRR